MTQRISLKQTHEKYESNDDDDDDSHAKSTHFFIDHAIEHLENGKFKMQDVISESHTVIAGVSDNF